MRDINNIDPPPQKKGPFYQPHTNQSKGANKPNQAS